MTQMVMTKDASEANFMRATRTGVSFTQDDREKLRGLLERRGLIEGSVVLSTGQKSNFYFDCKRVTLSADGASLVADAFLAEIQTLSGRPRAIGGLTHGADPIIGAIQMRALERGTRYEAFYVRKDKKPHGTMQWIENPPEAGTDVVIVDDVVTTGTSVVLAIEKAKESGCNVIAVIALVDREQGGTKVIKEQCSNYRSIYTLRDFPKLQGLQNTSRR